MRYFYADDKEGAVGPLRGEALLALKASGILTSLTKVKEEGAADWKLLAEIFSTEGQQAPSPISSADNAEGVSGDVLAQSETYKELADIQASGFGFGGQLQFAFVKKRQEITSFVHFQFRQTG